VRALGIVLLGAALLLAWWVANLARPEKPATLFEPPSEGAAASAPRAMLEEPNARRMPVPPAQAEGPRASAEASSAKAEREPVAPEADEEVLEVLVLDTAGRPVRGVPVLAGPLIQPRPGWDTRPGRPTDADGRARIPMRLFAGPELEQPGRHNAVWVNVTAEDPPLIDFGQAVPAVESVTLVLPAGGALELRVSEEDGTPVKSGASVEVAAYDRSGRRFGTLADVRDGRADVPWIELGLALELRAFANDQRTRPSERARARLAGPRAAGETVRAQLALGLEWPEIAFRVLDEGGQPLVLRKLRAHVNEHPLTPQDGRCITDSDGRARLRVIGDHRSLYERTLELVPDDAPDETEEHGVTLVLPRVLVRGRATELGDLVLGPR